MIITKTFLSRRTVLRGIGATVALPLLEAMVPPMTALARTSAKPPHRLGFVYTPMGADMTGWTPVGRKVGLGTLSRSLEPLSNLNGQVTVLTNVGLEHGDGECGVFKWHSIALDRIRTMLLSQDC